MSSRHLVDPELLPLLEFFTPGDFDALRLPAVRARTPPPAPLLPTVERSDQRSNPFETSPGVRLRVHHPTDRTKPLPAYLHIHGGGYVAGSPDSSDARNGSLASEVGCLVVSVDYRLAPEHRYPAALHDCYSALLWIAHNADSVGIDPARIAIGGESAGGGLAAALCLLARDRGEVAPAAQFLTVPMLDDRTTCRRDLSPYLGEFVWTRGSNTFGWASYLGEEQVGAETVERYAAPARNRDFAGLPATYIATGALDLFVEENFDYARHLLRAGVATELHLYPGAFHGFNLSPDAAVAQRYRSDLTDALRRVLDTPTAPQRD